MTRRSHVTTPAIVALAAMAVLGVVPHAFGQPGSTDDTVIQTSATVPQTNPQDSYRQRVRDEMADWRLKMRAFDDKVETGGQRHIDATETRLRNAWDDTEVEARNLQAATDHDWVRTKRAYEAAAHRIAMAWDRVRL